MSGKITRCFNLTDVETETLKRHGLVNQVIAIGPSLIRPGESADVADNMITRRDIKTYVELGVVAVDKLPVAYTVAKSHAASVVNAEKRTEKKKG